MTAMGSQGTERELRQRLDRIETRQEACIRAITGQTEVLEMIRDKLDELLEWAQTPPSSDLADAMSAVAAGLTGVQEAVLELANKLPASVAEAVREAVR